MIGKAGIVMKKVVIGVVAVLSAVLFLGFLQALLKPKYMTSIHEGNLIEEYYDEAKAHDVIFIGDCEVFSNISPVRLWQKYGITSYIRGSAQQLIWQSYYLLKETLTYEKPKVVVLNILAMKYNEPQKEAYNRLTLDGMKLSTHKIAAIRASMLEEESLLTYLFPLLRYHSRWSELTGEDLKYLFHKNTLSHNGYLMRVDTKPVTVIPQGKRLPQYRFGDRAYAYLDRITKLCKDNHIELILIKSPSVYPYWYEEWDKQMVDYAKSNGIDYINFLSLADEIGIDYSKDTFDGGLHLNLSGAEKFSDYLGKILQSEYGLADHRQEEYYTNIWKDKVAFYTSMKAEQEKELLTYGYLKSYGATAQMADSKE
jgi:hypothetical protein